MINSDKAYLDEFKIKIASAETVKLCEIVATFRYLGCMKDEALICMVELARRRVAGDDFAFEEQIETLLRELPIFKKDLSSKFKLPDFRMFK